MSLSSFSLVSCPHSLLSLAVCEPSAWVQPPLSSSHSSSTCVYLVWAVTPPSFPLDGAVLIQTWAAQWLVARAGQYGALGGCVSLSPHLWDGLRLSVVSTPPAQDCVIQTSVKQKNVKNPQVGSSLIQTI